ncbi:MAG: PTS system mannose/fructose/N-acetylgalactosamine-transporter subunit IIB [Anaerolineae bacterium]
MPVIHVRMDNRLIHGQILVSWNAEFKIDHIIVTNDQVAADPLQVTLLKAVAPIGAKVSVLSIKDCVAYCNGNPEAEKENIFIIAKFPEDGLALVENGLKMRILNLGNQAYVRGSKKISNTVYLTESGVKALKKLHEMGIRITCRMMPSDPDTEYWPTIEKTLPEWAK